MSRRKGMSDSLKIEMAKELGIYNVISTESWGSVGSKDCGDIVKKNIAITERGPKQ